VSKKQASRVLVVTALTVSSLCFQGCISSAVRMGEKISGYRKTTHPFEPVNDAPKSGFGRVYLHKAPSSGSFSDMQGRADPSHIVLQQDGGENSTLCISLLHNEYIPLELPAGSWLASPDILNRKNKFFTRDTGLTPFDVRDGETITLSSVHSVLKSLPTQSSPGLTPKLQGAGRFIDSFRLPQAFCPRPTALSDVLEEIPPDSTIRSFIQYCVSGTFIDPTKFLTESESELKRCIIAAGVSARLPSLWSETPEAVLPSSKLTHLRLFVHGGHVVTIYNC